ncbi:hypothetical protein [Limnoraphis robusta]|uniref:Sulfotransferase family protein n=1 Tax=Limnoraphis robusta CCNP1315 TaxID=3110306 RepID=A0ABU5U256_9CYAN|nr:hypothetical protein [Limnoraphis robusta]MEA5521281.1 hypothetical protein [Limnoraphis robusta CCNP1315]MEA5544875.1 hypothetical protein [Limnoraphis robusta CCNP1324]
MAIIVTPNLHVLETDRDLLEDFTIDSPKPGVSIRHDALNLSGWVVSRKSPAILVQLLKQDQVFVEVPVNIHRPRVAQRYAEILGSEKSGFEIPIFLSDELKETAEIILQVVLADQTRVPLAVLSFECDKKSYNKKTFFIHVAKTAGSSFNEFLKTYFYGDDHCEKYRKDGQQTQFTELDKLKSFEYISGHLTLREFQRDFKRDDYFLVTLLRDPIHQVISHLNWVYYVSEDVNSDFFKSHPRHDQEISLSVRKRNPSDYKEIIQALSDHPGLFANNQSRYFQTNNPFTSQNIIENLESFDLVGITENYQSFIDSYVNLHQKNMELIIHKENRNKKPALSKEELIGNPEFISFMNKFNSVDMEVYNYFLHRDKIQQSLKGSRLRLQKIQAEMSEQKYSLEQIKHKL